VRPRGSAAGLTEENRPLASVVRLFEQTFWPSERGKLLLMSVLRPVSSWAKPRNAGVAIIWSTEQSFVLKYFAQTFRSAHSAQPPLAVFGSAEPIAKQASVACLSRCGVCDRRGHEFDISVDNFIDRTVVH
jgi:hypothetical protein